MDRTLVSFRTYWYLWVPISVFLLSYLHQSTWLTKMKLRPLLFLKRLLPGRKKDKKNENKPPAKQSPQTTKGIDHHDKGNNVDSHREVQHELGTPVNNRTLTVPPQDINDIKNESLSSPSVVPQASITSSTILFASTPFPVSTSYVSPTSATLPPASTFTLPSLQSATLPSLQSATLPAATLSSDTAPSSLPPTLLSATHFSDIRSSDTLLPSDTQSRSAVTSNPPPPSTLPSVVTPAPLPHPLPSTSIQPLKRETSPQSISSHGAVTETAQGKRKQSHKIEQAYNNKVRKVTPHKPLSLTNVGATCYLNSGLQVLYCAQKKWQGAGEVTVLLSKLFGKKMGVHDFVSYLEPLLNMGNLRSCSDARKVVCAIINKVAAQDETTLARFMFRRLTKTYECLKCGHTQTVNPRGPPNGFYKYIDGTSENMATRLDITFNRPHECFDCTCDEDIREDNQIEHVYYEEYPEVALLCTSSAPAVSIAPQITLHKNNYKLVGFGLSLGGHAISIVQHSQKWYECDDGNVSEIKGDTNDAIRVAERRNGEAILLAYKKIKN